MSVKASSRVWESSLFNANLKLALLSLADRADDDGVCWPRVARTATKVGLKIRATQNLLRKLQDAGELYFDDRPLAPGDYPHYIVTCGMSQDEIHRVLVYHEKFRYKPERAAHIAAHIAALHAAEVLKCQQKQATEQDESDDLTDSEITVEPQKQRVQSAAPVKNLSTGAVSYRTGAFSCTKRVQSHTETGAVSCAPYKEETSIETSEETSERRKRAFSPPVSVNSIDSKSLAGGVETDPATFLPKLRKPKSRPDFPDEALLHLESFLHATGRHVQWQMDILPKVIEENAVKVVLCWFLEGRPKEDFARFAKQWPAYLGSIGKPAGERANNPSAAQWIEMAGAVLSLGQPSTGCAVVPEIVPAATLAPRHRSRSSVSPEEQKARAERAAYRAQRDGAPEHVSSGLNPFPFHPTSMTAPNLLDVTSRALGIQVFIEDLRIAKGAFPLSATELSDAARVFDSLLSVIGLPYLEMRDQNSLFAACAARGIIDAGGVKSVWDATMGHQIEVEAAEDRCARRDAREMILPVSSPPRQRLVAFLQKHGVDTDSL